MVDSNGITSYFGNKGQWKQQENANEKSGVAGDIHYA
jgi:hypothetical protein